MIVMLNLGGGEGMVQPQCFLNKLFPKSLPINVGVGNLMGIVIARGTAKLSC